MVLRGLLREWRERRDGTLEGPALDTGSITDTDDGQAWETLRELGYEKGDWFTILSPVLSRKFNSTSSTSYSLLTGRSQCPRVNWDTIPSGDGVAISFIGDVDTPTNGSVRVAEVDGFGNKESTLADTEVTNGDKQTKSGRHIFNNKPSGVESYSVAGEVDDTNNTAAIRYARLEIEVKIP